ncbi:coiled-coil domain-containing protein 181 [Denticeps clupeoides]|nr:coiled-coil domain-containing protein 181 [Denticeps clupeoides]
MTHKTQEEYEDDFEKDLDWLISEEEKSEDQDHEYEDIETQIDKELEEEEETLKRSDDRTHEEPENTSEEDEDRWPTPMEPVLEPDSDLISPSPLAPEGELDEEKKYILEKIEQANRQLQTQEAPDLTRRRRLQFKDTLVDLVVPALDNGSESGLSMVQADCDSPSPLSGAELNEDVSGRMLNLKITDHDNGSATDTIREGQAGSGKEGRVLVEKDGKFDFVSLKEVESHGLLPPLSSCASDNPHASLRQNSFSHIKSPSPSLRSNSSSTQFTGTETLFMPKPPPKSRNRPNSAVHSHRVPARPGTNRRVQSASSAPSQATFTLTPQQKEHLLRLQQRREKMAREEELRKREEEDQKKQENELAFKAWLMKKREQQQEERRVQRAQEMERMSCNKEFCDPNEAYKVWLQRKHEQQLKEKHLQDMKKLELESGFYFHNREECEKAFKMWLRRKRAEKRAEKLAARERSRRLVLEERRNRRMQDLLCTVNEAKTFRFSDAYGSCL